MSLDLVLNWPEDTERRLFSRLSPALSLLYINVISQGLIKNSLILLVGLLLITHCLPLLRLSNNPRCSASATKSTLGPEPPATPPEAPHGPLHLGPVLDPRNVALGLGAAVHGAVTHCAVNIAIWLRLKRIVWLLKAWRVIDIHSFLRIVSLSHLLLELLDLLRLSRPLPVRLPGNVGLVGRLAAHGERANITSYGDSLRFLRF